jgi:hypothetical protein
MRTPDNIVCVRDFCWILTWGFVTFYSAMFEPIREQIDAAAAKTTQLRRFL